MLVSYRNKCPNLHHPVRIRFSRERQCFWNVWHPVRSNNVETTFVCFLSCRCKVWCGVVGVFHIFHSPIAIENISRQGDLSFRRFEWYPDIPSCLEWPSFYVQRGDDDCRCRPKDERVLSVTTARGVLSSNNWLGDIWHRRLSSLKCYLVRVSWWNDEKMKCIRCLYRVW